MRRIYNRLVEKFATFKLKLSLVFWLMAVCSVAEVTAQKEPRIYKMEGGEQVASVIPFNERFQFDHFKKGVVYLLSGRRSDAMLNYSFVFNEVQFLGPEGDTLSIIEKNQIRFVLIGEVLYYYDKDFGFVEIIAELDAVKIGRKRGLVPLGSDKYVGYGQYVGASASTTYKTFVSPTGQMSKLDKKTNTILTSRTSYFFIDKNNRFYVARRNSIPKIYGRFKNQVVTYLDENSIDFDNEEDLKKLITFCNDLK
jgi:hypothetical protein